MSPADNKIDDSNHHDTLWTMHRIDVRPRISLLATNERPLSCLCIPQAILNENATQSISCENKFLNYHVNRFSSTNSLNQIVSSNIPATISDKNFKLKLLRQNSYPQFDHSNLKSLAFKDYYNRISVADSLFSITATTTTTLSSLSPSPSSSSASILNQTTNRMIISDESKNVLSQSHKIINVVPRLIIPTSSLISIACATTTNTTTTTLTSTIANAAINNTTTTSSSIDNSNNKINVSIINKKMPPLPSTKSIKNISLTKSITTTTNIITTTTTTTTTIVIIPHPYIVKHNSDTTPNSSNSSTAVRRQRHSIAGQMSYFKMLGFGGYSKKMATSTNSLFSTAVISGSSSAPNLRDMIPCAASSSGK